MTRIPRELALAVIVAVLVAGIGLRAPVFVTPDNLLGVLMDTAFLFMLASAQLPVLLTRGIDLSVAANLALSGMVCVLATQAAPTLPIAAVLLLAVATGLALGLLNAALVAGIGIPPIVATLGTLAIFRGVIFLIAGGKWITSQGMTEAFLAFPRSALLGAPTLLLIAATVTGGIWFLLTRTTTGRALYALGGNPVAARYVGLPARRLVTLTHAIAGAVSGLCGALWVSRYGIAYTDIAAGYELTVIAACVIGGVSISGGIGTVPGVLLGALFLGVVVNALPVIDVSPFWQMAISGVVILAAVVANARAERRPGRLILPEARA